MADRFCQVAGMKSCGETGHSPWPPEESSATHGRSNRHAPTISSAHWQRYRFAMPPTTCRQHRRSTPIRSRTSCGSNMALRCRLSPGLRRRDGCSAFPPSFTMRFRNTSFLPMHWRCCSIAQRFELWALDKHVSAKCVLRRVSISLCRQNLSESRSSLPNLEKRRFDLECVCYSYTVGRQMLKPSNKNGKEGPL